MILLSAEIQLYLDPHPNFYLLFNFSFFFRCSSDTVPDLMLEDKSSSSPEHNHRSSFDYEF